MTALVLAVLFAIISLALMLKVSISISANIGVAPVKATAFAVAAKVNDGTITSSFGLIPRDNKAACKAEVPALRATHGLPSTSSEKFSSKVFTFFP
jgi:hypothetical protein